MSSFLEFTAALDWRSWLITVGVVFVGIPLVATILNVASQLLLPKDPSLPPLVFHWFPFIGSSLGYGLRPIDFFLECREKYGDIFTFVLLGRKVTVALGPKGNDFVLGGKISHLSAEEAYTSLTTPVFGKGVVFDVPNPQLMEQKRFIKFGLTTENFRTYVGLIVKEVDSLLDTHPALEAYRVPPSSEPQWGEFSAFKVMSELTIYTASRTLQGEEIRQAVDGSFADLYHDLDGGFKPINLFFGSLPLPMNRRRDRAQLKMSNFYVDIIKARRATGHAESYDMLAALMDQSYKDGRTLGDRELAHIMIALLMAGQHTSSATSSWALLHSANRPDIWQAVYDEQVEHFGNGDGTFRDLEYEDLRNLPVLDSLIRETLRVHPPIHSILRHVKADLPVPPTLASSGPSNCTKASENAGYVVPKGHLVLASPAVSQADPRIWKEGRKWEPSRWSDPEGVAALALDLSNNGEKVDYGFGAVSKGTESPYQPFGAGRHRCIGEQFAYLQLGVIVATLARAIEMRIDKVPAHNYRTMITVPMYPDFIQFRRRR